MRNIYSKFKRRIKLKNTFQKLIFSYVIIISIIMLISAVILYNGYRNQIIDQSKVISNKLLNQSNYYAEFTMDWARIYLYQMYLDSNVHDLIFKETAGIQKNPDGIDRIKKAVAMHPSVQSVYVYNSTNDIIYPSDGKPSYYLNFSDKEIVNILKENNDTFSKSFIPRKINTTINGKQYEKDILTIILSNLKSSKTDMPYGAIVLNLDAKNIQKYYENLTEKDYSIFAIDNYGRIILNSDPNLFLKDISAKDYINKILVSENDNGSFFSVIDGDHSIVSYRTNKKLGLKFINIIPYDSLTTSINKMLYLLINTSIVLFILSIAIVFISFRRIYSPIDRTIKAVREYLITDETSEKDKNINEIDEFNENDYLAKVIDIIISRPIQIKKLSTVNLNIIKNQLLTGLLLNTPFEINNFKNKLQELEVNMNFNNIIVLLFEIDSYNIFEAEHTREEIEGIKLDIYNESKRIILEHYKNELVATDEDKFCVIVSMEDKMNDNTMNNIIQNIQKIQNYSYDQYSISLSVAIGDSVDNVEETSKSYKSALDYINYRFKYGYNSILEKNKIEEGILENSKFQEDLEEAVFKELRAGSLTKVEIEVEKIFQHLHNLSYNDLQLAVSHFLVNSHKSVNNILQINKSDIDDISGELNSDLTKFKTLDEVEENILNMFTTTIEHLKEKKKNRKNEVIDNIIMFIEENYSDALLSPDSLADQFNLSPNYIRVLFKNAEGKSLSSFINEVRFKKAKEILETTDDPIAEISAKVGFSNDNYFYTAFKKFYGVSPNSYRNSIKT